MNQARIATAVLVVALSACKAAAPGEASSPAPATAPAPVVAAATTTMPAPAAVETAAPAAAKVELPEGACAKTEDGFDAFLEQFVYEAPVRTAYSAAQIEVRDIKNPARLIATQAPAQADPFRIALVDSQWSYDEPGKDPGQLSRIKLDRKLSGDRMRLDFVKAEFSPDEDVVKTLGPPEAYVFQFKGDCWQLAQHLR
ncbi:MAG: hypothetical protein ACREP7_17400 [Lysobacter sp.]